jgi:hypothetical protein
MPRLCLVAVLLFMSTGLAGCSFSLQLGSSADTSHARSISAKALSEAIVELDHPSGQVSTGLQISPLSGYPTVIVRSRGAAGRFVLDTGGAGTLIVTQAFLSEVGGKRVRNRQAVINGTRFAVAIIPKLTVGDRLILRNAPAIISELDQMRQVCGDVAIDGVLTGGMLKDLEIDIDMPNRVAHFRPAHMRQVPANAIPLRRPVGRSGDPRPFAIIRIGEADVPALLDTGNYVGIDIPEHLFAETGVTLDDARDSFGGAGFSSRPARTQRGRIAEMALGDITLTDTEAHVIPHADVTEAIIGTAVLRHFRLIHNGHTRTTLLVGPNEIDHASADPDVITLVERICREHVR